MRLAIYVLGILLIFVFGCRKYSEGPKLSFRTVKHRISGNWQIESYTINDVDSLIRLPYDKITIEKIIRVTLRSGFYNDQVYNYRGGKVLSYPEGEYIGVVFLSEDKTTLTFHEPIVDFGNRDLSPNDMVEMIPSSLAGKFFLYEAKNWLGEIYSKGISTFSIVKLKENNMTIISPIEAIKSIKYEFKKIK